MRCRIFAKPSLKRIWKLTFPDRLENECICAFLYFHTLCMREAKALASLRISAGSIEPSLLADAINFKISCVGLALCFAWRQCLSV